MKIYVTPYNPKYKELDYLNIHAINELNFFSVYYKSSDGPLGFGIDEISAEIFREIVKYSFYYSEYDNEIFSIRNDESDIRYNGIFMFPTELIKEELENERKLKLIRIKNSMYRKYKKELLKETPTMFTDFFNAESKTYVPFKIQQLIQNKIDFAIAHSGWAGTQFNIRENSIFMTQFLEACKKNGVPIVRVDDVADVPYW